MFERLKLARTFVLLLAGVLLAGCAATKKIDWGSRVGNYTFDQAVIDLGPPDKQAKLSDGSTVAEWRTSRGQTYAFVPTGFYGHFPWSVGPYYILS